MRSVNGETSSGRHSNNGAQNSKTHRDSSSAPPCIIACPPRLLLFTHLIMLGQSGVKAGNNNSLPASSHCLKPCRRASLTECQEARRRRCGKLYATFFSHLLIASQDQIWPPSIRYFSLSP